jgi:hypothetical protein
MKRFAPLALLTLLVLVAAQAGAANLLTNGSFQSGDFTGWTLGTTADGTAGAGFPVIAPYPPNPAMNSAKYEVGQVNSNGLFEGATLSQSFTTTGGSATLSFLWTAMGDGIHQNAEGGLFELVLDGSVIASHDVGTINPNDTLSGTLSDTLNLSAGSHTFEIEILRNFLSNPGNTPYQYVTGADAEAAGGVPEPGTLMLLGSGVVGLGGLLRRKLNF